MPGRLGLALRLLAPAVLLILAVVGWHYSGQILGPDAPPALDEIDVLAVTDTSVKISPDPNGDARDSRVAALEWPGGFGEMLEPLAADSSSVTRRFRPLAGRPPAGGRASARPFAFAADPRAMLGVAFETVPIVTPVGDCPAWVMRGGGGGGDDDDANDSAAWMIFVHGRGSVRAQALRAAPVFLGLGWNVLAISYRNDDGAARAGDGRYRLGADEWEDLEAAVRWAEDRGAGRIVVVGYSMGGAIALQFLRRSARAARVDGVILDGPVLRWRPVFDLAARERGVHPALTSLGMAVASLRAGIRWEALDLIAPSAEYRTPMLVFHGTADPTVPPALSESLAVRRPDLVTLVRVVGAGHVRCWNTDPMGYEAAVTRWLGPGVPAR